MTSDVILNYTSRNDDPVEIEQLEAFESDALLYDVVKYINRVHYNSKSCICEFELIDGIEEYSAEALAIKVIALKNISQFEWFNDILHGGKLNTGFSDVVKRIIK